MLDLDRLRRSQPDTEPFRHGVLDGLIAQSDLDALVAAFPRSGWHDRAGDDGEKTWRNQVCNLVALPREDGIQVVTQDGPWGELAKTLLSAEYREAVSAFTGVDLTRATVDANLFQYGPAHWLGPHCDVADKAVTHLVYFNTDWKASSGGCLRILRSKNSADCFREVTPELGRSVFLVRSESSWHEVSRLKRLQRTRRRSIQVTFWAAGSEATWGSLPYYG